MTVADTVRDELYGARTIKRERRTNDRLRQLDDQIVEVLTQDHPQSVRHVFYRMTNPRLKEPVEKLGGRGYRHVQHRLKKLRRSGAVPYHWISDATRRGHHVNTFDSAADFLRRMNGLYRADLWHDSPYYCEVWTESRSLAGVIQNDCEELAVSLYPAGGFSSITLAFEAADYINQRHNGREVVIFYVGDYDPAGVLIDVALEKELRAHLSSDIDLHFERIAITEEQIKQYDLPSKPRNEGDRRAAHVQATVEAEAMPAGIMRQLLRAHVEALLPPDALAIAKAAEDSERMMIDGLAGMLERSA